MCFAWFIASASIFLARPHLFPVFFRKSGLLILFTVLPLVLMFFWLVRVRFAKAYRKKPIPPGVRVHSLLKNAPYLAGTAKPEVSLQLAGTLSSPGHRPSVDR
jgi:hypothetical protein